MVHDRLRRRLDGRAARRSALAVLFCPLAAACAGSGGADPNAQSSGGQSSVGGQGSVGGQATGGAGQAPILDVPTDTSQDGIAAFIDATSYQSASWASTMSGPTSPPSGTTSPHGLEHIFYNHTLRQSHAEGHLGSFSDPFAVGSMSVKEMYTGDTVIGHAALVRTDASWLFYCQAAEDERCFIGSKANVTFYSTNPLGSCTCHAGGTVVTVADMPPP
jgi:hypothetical protein